MKLEKVAHFKNNFLVNGSLNNWSLIFAGIFLTLTLHASISTDNNMTNANLINISIEVHQVALHRALCFPFVLIV